MADPQAATPPPGPGPAGAQPASWEDIIGAEAKKQQVDPRLALAVAKTESGLNPGAKSPVGAVGLMQLMPETAKRHGVDPSDPVQNIRGGVAELKALLDQHGGDVRTALMRYNGSAQADPKVTGAYADRVLGALGSGTATPGSRPQMTFATVNGQNVPVNQPAATPPPAPQSPAPQSPVDRAMADPATRAFDAERKNPQTAQMLGGMGGALAVGAATEGLGLIPEAAAGAGALIRGGTALARTLAPAVGAYGGGAAVAGAQGGTLGEMHDAGTTQAEYELGGQGFSKVVSWPIRRFLAHPVAKAAGTALTKAREEVNTQLDAILSKADAALRGTKEGVAKASATANEAVRGARAGVDAAQQAADAQTAQVAGQWPSTPPPPGANQAAGQQVNAVATGPAKYSLDKLGQNVEAAAQSGPPVPIAPLEQRLAQLKAQMRPAASHAPVMPAIPGYTPEQVQALAAKSPEIAAMATIPPDHPLGGVLGQVEEYLQAARDSAPALGSGEPTIPFADAHKIKRALDEAVNWDSPAKKQVQQATKGLRGTLRDTMAGHAPYDQATQAYKDAVPLFRKGYVPQVAKSAIDNPEAIVKMIKGDQPTKIQMLHDVLINHAAEGGGEAGAAQGQQAWNSVRAAWTYENLIKGGVENFPAKLAKLHPDFLSTMYGDAEGQQVLQNLQQISTAFQQAGVAGDAAVAGAKDAATTASEAAERTKEQGRIAINEKSRDLGATKTQVAAAKKPTAVEQAFAQSSLASAPPPAQLASDAVHTIAMHGANVFRVNSAARLLLRGPKTADLVQWAAYSPARTQALVRAVTGPAPGMAIANMLRMAGLSDEPPMAPSHGPTGPVTAAATPPPGPPR